MSTIMIRCAFTDQEFSTGIETDPDNFAKVPYVRAFAKCPHCGMRHEWWRDDAWLSAPLLDRREEVRLKLVR